MFQCKYTKSVEGTQQTMTWNDPYYHFHFHVVIEQTLLSKATYKGENSQAKSNKKHGVTINTTFLISRCSTSVSSSLAGKEAIGLFKNTTCPCQSVSVSCVQD